MWLIAGLGNPGPRYERTRHNLGFLVLERLVRDRGVLLEPKFRGEFASDGEVAFLKPATFMNASGESLRDAAEGLGISVTNIVVIHDELDLAWGDVRVKIGGGSAGNNGLKSIIQCCGADFVRVRVGIGKPSGASVVEWVLSDFDESESATLPDVLSLAARIAKATIELGPTVAQNQFNSRAKPSTAE